MIARFGQSRDRVTRKAMATLSAMAEVARVLIPQIIQWLTTNVVAKGKILHAGITQARSIVRNKAGKKVEFGLPYLLSRLGGGYVFGRLIHGVIDEHKMPLVALEQYREIWGAEATPELVVYDRAGGCYNHPHPLGPRGGEAHWHSAQGAAALASCRGSPAAGAKRAGQDRRDHWHVEKQQIWVQQTQGTSLADAGDGGSEVYRIVQFEQIDARFGSVENVRQNGIGANQSGKMKRVGSRG
jgi:hypothetical protein